MSYNNIKACQESSIEQIVDVIEVYDLDIVVLQKVDINWSERSDYRNQIRYLEEALNMQYFLEKYIPCPWRTKLQQYGLVFLSRYPFKMKQNHSLTHLSSLREESVSQKMSGVPEILVHVAGRKIHMFNTHLDYRSDPDIWKIQIDEMLAIMNDIEAPTLLLTSMLNLLIPNQ